MKRTGAATLSSNNVLRDGAEVSEQVGLIPESITRRIVFDLTEKSIATTTQDATIDATAMAVIQTGNGRLTLAKDTLTSLL